MRKHDTAKRVAFDQSAPASEVFSAQAELQKAHTNLSGLIPSEQVRPVIDYILNDLRDQDMMKAQGGVVVPFPSKNAGKKGIQSVKLDDLQIAIMGDYIERPGMLDFHSLRAMVDQTPVLSAVLLTRVRQVQAFCRRQESGHGAGFVVRHADAAHELQDDERKTIELLQRFFVNCGWEFNPRQRKRLGRQSLRQMMAMSARDSLTMDSAPIETEFKRDRSLGIDGFYAIDGASIRLCTEEGYKGDDEIFALQVVQGQIRTAYDFNGLIYEPRNPRSDVTAAGYGLSETELLIKVVTGFLNAMTLNIKGFSDNAIPKGMLHLTGNYDAADLQAFKRYWNGMVKGVNNAWSVPVMVSKDQESKASFENFGVDFSEMMFSKWMTFLTSIICAVYGMSPSEINFDSFTGGGASPLSGSDTAERLTFSKDSGLRPLMSYYENLFSDYILAEFGDSYVFRWTGIDPDDQDKRHEAKKLTMSVNEMRAELGLEKQTASWGEAPLNPSLIGPWSQEQAAANQPGPDYGGQPGQDGPGAGDDGPPGAPGQDPGQPGQQPSNGAPVPNPAAVNPQGAPAEDPGADPGEDPEKLQKALPPAANSRGKSLLAADKAPEVDPTAMAAERGIGLDDHVFARHAQHGVMSGKVLAYGRDGFMVEHPEAGKVGVPWDGYLGHKSRPERKLSVVEKGEGGSIVQDDAGRRHYLAGDAAEFDGEDPDLDAERALILGDDQPLAKAAPAAQPAPVVVNMPDSTDFSPALMALQKSIADQGDRVAAALAEQSARIEAVSDASVQSAEARRSELMTKAIVGAIAEDRKPLEISLKLEMPEQKTVSKTIRRNPDGSMTVVEGDQ